MREKWMRENKTRAKISTLKVVGCVLCNNLYKAVTSEPEKLVFWVATVISKYDDVIDDVIKKFSYQNFSNIHPHQMQPT